MHTNHIECKLTFGRTIEESVMESGPLFSEDKAELDRRLTRYAYRGIWNIWSNLYNMPVKPYHLQGDQAGLSFVMFLYLF